MLRKQGKVEGGLYPGGLKPGVFLCLQGDWPIIGGGGAYKWQFTVPYYYIQHLR